MAIQNVRIPLADGGSIRGILSEPAGSGLAPAVVFLGSIRGIDTEFAPNTLERLAGEGFVALGPDLFDHPDAPENPRERPNAQPDPEILGDMEGSLRFLNDHPRSAGQPVFA